MCEACIQISQEGGKVVSYPRLFKNFPQFVVIHTVKGFGIVNEADVFFCLFCFVLVFFLELLLLGTHIYLLALRRNQMG